MINFIIAFATYDSSKHINHAEWVDTNDGRIILATIQAIRNINKVHSNTDKKIILNGEVSVTENLVVEKLTTTSNSTTPITLDNHYHTHGDPAGNTGEPTN
jgi:hypothetical protein